MKILMRNASIFFDNRITKKDILVSDGKIISVSDNINCENAVVFDFNNKYIFPGFVDVHVHFREPGFLYKETIKTGTLAAAHGGYTSVCTMPNLKPCPDCYDNLKVQTDAIDNDAAINVYPYGAVTVGELGEKLSDIDGMSKHVIAFSDDGKGIQNAEMMLSAMKKIKDTGKVLSAHCEDNSLLKGGYIHNGEYAKEHNHKGISSESEWEQIERDIELCRMTGVKYHVCHVSAKESIELIRQAKKDGVDITCETAPHYLVLNDSMLKEDGKFKMNPPVRDEQDRLALIEGILDGTIDMIATDHAPHSAEEKSKGLEKSLMGVVGLETAFPILYTELVKLGVITLEKLIELMSIKPAERFGLMCGIKEGMPADMTVFDLTQKYRISTDDFLSKGRATPFDGYEVFGKCCMTMCNGKIVYEGDNLK